MWTLIQWDWYPHKKRKSGHRYTEGRFCEVTARRWPSTS